MAEESRHYDVNITAGAKNDLKDIIAYISRNNPKTAMRILKKIETKINTLDRFPCKGGYVPELLRKNITEYRQLIESPWRIIYRIDNNVVNVLLIIDSRRNIQDILMQKLLK